MNDEERKAINELAVLVAKALQFIAGDSKAATGAWLREADKALVIAAQFQPQTWTGALASRRAELVEKKHRSSLTAAELAELAALQEAFGKYQDSISQPQTKEPTD